MAQTQSQTKRLKDRYAKYEDRREHLLLHVTAGIKSIRLAKNSAYDMACEYVAMQRDSHNELLDMLKGRYPNESDPIAKWIEASFAPLTHIGEDIYALIKAVGDGMTRNAYLAQSPGLFLAGKRSDERKQRIASTPVPDEPDDHLSDGERCRRYKVRQDAMDKRLSIMRTDLAVLQRENALLKKELKKVQRIVDHIVV